MNRLPICLMVDDPEPVMNPLYCERITQQVAVPRQQSGEAMVATFPMELIERFAAAIRHFDIHGKFSIIPFPGGLGSILTGWPGTDKAEIDRWLKIARDQIAPQMDITPEMLTHARALDLATKTLLPEREREWSYKQAEATLTPYITYALELLKAAGFDANGVTSPWDFGKPVEAHYARAVLNAQRAVYGRSFSWYFLDIDENPAGEQSHVSLRTEDGGTVVHIVSKCDDFLWQTMETQETGEDYVRTIADAYLDPKGEKGKLAELYAAGVPIIFHTHWQLLGSNGRLTGLAALETVFERINRAWGDRVEWTRCSTLAQRVADTR